LNSLNISGLPPHKLSIKVGAVVMLIRNLNKSLGMVNGARLIVTPFTENLIAAKFVSGKFKNKTIFLSSIIIIPNDTGYSFTTKRHQFPIMTFALTINKAQGQSFKQIGIYLSSNVFSHGKLYVAFSRATKQSGVIVELEDDSINTTYKCVIC